ncbi:hypothetical protein [Thermoleptolyngbya sp. PKUAC-SCTB121]|uniref:hypothetical protein n=1 Tax=Thermoleptolyngbya sp. PKUAC-SCTB121 TaxID=2811482 RepID=UPI001963A260|nr:hypothetical protein [Thermoleptolyngbya sp. PKUAC-SCTB121]
MPKQEVGEISLREHQMDALKQLEELRNRGKTIALLTHATAEVLKDSSTYKKWGQNIVF